jgi:hypothetical protein
VKSFAHGSSKAPTAGFNYTHPCKERKDGAPSVLVRTSEIKSPGHPPRT